MPALAISALTTARLITVTPDGKAVRTRHGLVPRASAATTPASQRRYPARTSGTPYRAFHVALSDLGELGGRAIARFAAERLDLRNTPLDTTTTQDDHARSNR